MKSHKSTGKRPGPGGLKCACCAPQHNVKKYKRTLKRSAKQLAKKEIAAFWLNYT